MTRDHANLLSKREFWSRGIKQFVCVSQWIGSDRDGLMTSWALGIWLPCNLSIWREKGRWLETLQSLEKILWLGSNCNISKERVRGIPEQIVACPGPPAAPHQLKKKQVVKFPKILEKMLTPSHMAILRPTYMASQENVVIQAAVEVFLQATSHCRLNDFFSLSDALMLFSH